MKPGKKVAARIEWNDGTTTPILLLARRFRATITQEHVEQSYWSRFRDPVANALREILNDNTAVCALWQSDGWRPRYADDEASVILYLENHDDNGLVNGQVVYEAGLSRRVESAMKRLAGMSRGEFRETPIILDLPVCMSREAAGEPQFIQATA